MSSDHHPNKLQHQSKAQAILFEWYLDLLTYIVILNLFDHYSDNFYMQSFSLSILVAFSMKILMVLILGLKSLVSGYIKAKVSKFTRTLDLFVKFLILFSSKFVVIEVLSFKYGDLVYIKGFVSVTALILTMMLTRKLLEYIYQKAGQS